MVIKMLKWLKKKVLDTSGKEDLPIEDWSKLSTADLQENYGDRLHEYELGIKAEWRLVALDIEDATSISYERDEINDIVDELTRRKVAYDKKTLKSLDDRWISWLLRCIKEGDVKEPFYVNEDESTEKWWFHIETIDKLKHQ